MKRNMGKKRLAFILVAVCLVGLIGIGISYSYYLASISTSNEQSKNSDISSATITQVVMDMQGKVSSNGVYPGHVAVKEVVVRGIGESNSIPANASIKITPDLGVFGNDVSWDLFKSDTPITCSSTVHKDGGQYYEDATCDLPESASPLVLEGGSETIYKNIVVNPNTETKYYLVVGYRNRKNEDQSSLMDKSFSIDISIEEEYKSPVINKKADVYITDLAFNSKDYLATDDPDNNVRYIGKEPSNYVYFNCSDYNNQSADTCELWRIIGVFNNVTKTDGTKENLVKIIRNDFLGYYSWDGKKTGVGTSTYDDNFYWGSNDWTDSQLMMMLNPTNYLKPGYTNSNDIVYDVNGQEIYSKMGSYYNGTKGCSPVTVASGTSFSCTEVDFTSKGLKNDTTRNAIEEVIWNLGGSSTARDVTTNMFYERERGTTVYTSRPTTWTGKIGLMYPSDHGYATSGGAKKDRAACLAKELSNWNSSDFSDCKRNDYLLDYDKWQWTLAPYSADSFDVFYVYSPDGSIYTKHASDGLAVRPALFLKSSILVDKGTGTSNDPYQLKIS